MKFKYMLAAVIAMALTQSVLAAPLPDPAAVEAGDDFVVDFVRVYDMEL